MKTLRGRFLTVVALLLVGVPVSAQTVKLGTVAPKGSPWYKMSRHMAEAWSAATDGKINVRIYPGGVAGDDPDMVRKMRVGQLHAAMLTGQGLAEISTEIQALHMPLLLTSYKELDYVMKRLTPYLESAFKAKGFKVLNWGEAGWVYFFTQVPVVHPAELKPLRLFAWSSDSAFIEAWKDAGYNPVPLAVTEMLTGLQSGLINAFVAPPIAALAFQWFGLAKHMTDLKWAPLVGATVISMNRWQQIPENLRPTLLQAARDASARFKQEIRKVNEDSIEVMKKHGLVVHHVPADVVGDWERGARAGYTKLIGRVVSAQMVDEVERLRNEYRASQKSK